MIHPAAREALFRALGAAIRFDADTRRLTSLRVGGPADALASPPDRDALSRTLAICAEHDVPVRPLGRGFNTLVRDEGVDGVLLQLSAFRVLEQRGDGVLAEAGVSHASVTRFCRERGLSGLEFAAGIPGCVGGWVAMNAGIGEREMKEVVSEIEVLAAGDRGPRLLPRSELHFAYRALHGLGAGDVILSVHFALQPSTPEAVGAATEALLARRQATQPLDAPSCGSVFKNPPGRFAGQLIESAGLKGAQEGGAMISPVHANFIVNTGGARASDVLALIERARTAVLDHHGIHLETEVRILGRGQ